MVHPASLLENNKKNILVNTKFNKKLKQDFFNDEFHFDKIVLPILKYLDKKNMKKICLIIIALITTGLISAYTQADPGDFISLYGLNFFILSPNKDKLEALQNFSIKKRKKLSSAKCAKESFKNAQYTGAV